MKANQFFKCASAAAVVLLAAILFSCSKQDIIDSPIAQERHPQMNEDDHSIMNKIIAFKELIEYAKENPDYKSGATMTAEEVVWNLETLFNATYGFPDEQYGHTVSDTTLLYIAINSNGEILEEDVIALYNEIIAIVTQYYYNSGFDQKGFLLLDLTQGEIVNGQLEIGLRSVTGEKNYVWEPFGIHDYWWYGETKGDCNWIIGFNETDAAQKIQVAIMQNKPLVYPPPGYRFVYSSFDTINVFGHEYTNNNNEYLVFYIENPLGIFTWEEKCLDPDEMNFHFFGESEVIYHVLPGALNKPPNWTFMSCIIVGKEEPNYNNGNIPCIHHENTLTYALRYLVPVVIIEPPIDL